MRAFFVGTILVFCCLAIGCTGWAFKIRTENMSPALKIGDTCVVNKFDGSAINRFDIVVFQMPEDVKKMSGETGDIKIISRVIGLPNEKIEIRQGKVYINDKTLDEPFEKTLDTEKDFSAFVIPEDEYFLLGDNRPQSLDSRYWKKPTIAKQDISGKVAEVIK
jgi:signal peptidase I